MWETFSLIFLIICCSITLYNVKQAYPFAPIKEKTGRVVWLIWSLVLLTLLAKPLITPFLDVKQSLIISVILSSTNNTIPCISITMALYHEFIKKIPLIYAILLLSGAIIGSIGLSFGYGVVLTVLNGVAAVLAVVIAVKTYSKRFIRHREKIRAIMALSSIAWYSTAIFVFPSSPGVHYILVGISLLTFSQIYNPQTAAKYIPNF
eukprot:gb/GECH01001684.1/.p1 GENE.gb/GECH01001684.1/~~gb/GECH01001684.1/.p1  ORF type:complete len:206 (+),score=26.47 gb/GECH01001684.1/:1-618(+)